MRSRSRLLRLLLTLTTLVVVWLVASPALASTESLAAKAPLCDPRGAVTFAPPPQMQQLEVSLDIGTFDDCGSSSSEADARHADTGRPPVQIDASSSREPLTRAATTPVAGPASELVPAPAASEVCSRPGVRSTVDRPPRA